MRVVLADASGKVRSALRLTLEQMALEQQTELEIVGEARDAISLMAQVARCCPDVILLDVDLPGMTARARLAKSALAELVETLRLLCPASLVVALHSRPNAEKECLEAGADAFACKSDPPDALLALLKTYAQSLPGC